MMGTITLRKIMSPCWCPSVVDEGEKSSTSSDSSCIIDGSWWYKDLGIHVHGEFSMAVIEANNVLEDYCQVESGPLSLVEKGPQGTFVGIYDGHGGPEASMFISNQLFENIKKLTYENQGMSAEVINKAYLATEDDFLSLVKKEWKSRPQIASVGSCCLVGIICNGVLYIANAGDSRAVLGRRLQNHDKETKAIQLSSEHNASLESVREELHSLHPHDPDIVVLNNTVWRVKGIIQVSRSIGDAYLKRAEFNRPPLLPKFRVPETFQKPILKAEPSIHIQRLHPEDKFLIFASDGLWEHLSNEEAVSIVHTRPRNGIARKLIKAALVEAAKKREMRYSDLKRIDQGLRRHFHDDISVIVLFLDSHVISRSSFPGPAVVSLKGGVGTSGDLTS